MGSLIVKSAITCLSIALAVCAAPLRPHLEDPATRDSSPPTHRLAPGIEIVLVSGATGRTGSLAYFALRSSGVSVRALVRNASKAREVLDCGACTEAEGIFVGDVTLPQTLPTSAFVGADALLVTTGSFPYQLPNGSWSYPSGGFPVDVDFHGCNAQVALARNSGVRRIVLISSMGTTQPGSFLDRLGGGFALMYKLASEAHLMSVVGASRKKMAFTIIKPAGLLDAKGGKAALIVGHDDVFIDKCGANNCMAIPREDVAATAVAALTEFAPDSYNLRLDLRFASTKSARPHSPPPLFCLIQRRHSNEYREGETFNMICLI